MLEREGKNTAYRPCNAHPQQLVWLRLQNVVVYAGGRVDQDIIRKHEFWFPNSKGRSSSGPYRFNVLLTSYETMLRDKSVFKSIKWETVIIDEAHRLKVR